MRVTITIADNTLYANGRALQRMEPGEQVTLDSEQAEYKIIVYRKLDKRDRKIIRLAKRQEQP
jgi:hypothetical protein